MDEPKGPVDAPGNRKTMLEDLVFCHELAADGGPEAKQLGRNLPCPRLPSRDQGNGGFGPGRNHEQECSAISSTRRFVPVRQRSLFPFCSILRAVAVHFEKYLFGRFHLSFTTQMRLSLPRFSTPAGCIHSVTVTQVSSGLISVTPKLPRRAP